MAHLLRNTLIASLVFSSGCLTAVGENPIGAIDAGNRTPDAGQVDAGSNPDAGHTTDAGTFTGDGGALTPLTCAPGRWCWQHPSPQPGQALESVFVVNANEAWAGGTRGALSHLKNGQWTAMTPFLDFPIVSLWGTSGNDMWAVARKSFGGASRLIHFTETSWNLVSHGTNPNISNLAGSADGELWILTYADTTLIPSELKRWNGTEFVAVTSLPAGFVPNSVCVRSATEAWVVASDANNSHPLHLLRFDGTTWSQVHSFTPGSSSRFNSRVGCPADGVAVVTAFNFNQGAYDYFEVKNGQTSFTPAPVGVVLMLSPHNDVFAVDGRAVSQWTPSGFSPRFTLGNTESPYSTDFDFVGSTGWLANLTPVLSSWNGAQFTPAWQRFGSVQTFVAPLPSPNANDPVAVFGSGTFGTRTGASSWSFGMLPNVAGGDALSVVDAFVLPNGDAWLVGNAIARFTASSQNVTPVVQLGGFERLNDIDGTDANNLWAVGTDAKVYRFTGSQWAQPAIGLPTSVDGVSLSSLTLTKVDVRGPNDVMILGDDPAGGRFLSIFFKWDGVSWEAMSSAGATLSHFDRDTAGTLYTIEGSTVKRREWTDTMWTTIGEVPGSPMRLRVYGRDEIELVSRIDSGATLFQWDMDRMAFDPDVTPLAFDGVLDIVPGAPTTGGRSTYWASGSDGAVLRFESP